MSQLLNENQTNLLEKWSPMLNESSFGEIKDTHRRLTTAQLLENQEKESLTEDAQTTTQNIAGFDPVLINMVRRSAPKMIAYDVCAVQAMTMPTGLVFAMRARYDDRAGEEALFQQVKTGHSGDSVADSVDNPFLATMPATIGGAQVTNVAEMNDKWATMSATIDKVQVTANTRQLRADYSIELKQDWKTVHGMNADSELASILANEIMIEQNQEIVRNIYKIAKVGAQFGQTKGTFDLLADSDGRWSAERYKGLLFAINRDANRIAYDTRRGKGNILITSADVASALQMAGLLDFAPALESLTGKLEVDITGTTYAGNMGQMKVFIDPFLQHDGYVVGYKGANAYDAGLIYCPYIALQAHRAVHPTTFHEAIGFKTRYGLVANPFTSMNVNENIYYRKAAVVGL